MSYGTLSKALSLAANLPASIALYVLFAMTFGWPIAVMLYAFGFILSGLSGVCDVLQKREDAKNSPFAYLVALSKLGKDKSE